MNKLYLFLFLFLSYFLFAQDGTLDLTFNTPVHTNNPLYNGFKDSSGNLGTIYTTKKLNNGKILVYGDFSLYQGVLTNKMAILNPNGSLDSSFNVGQGPNYVDSFSNSSSMICEQPDGKIIVIGSFTTFNGLNYKNIVRLNINGTIDTTFSAGTASNGSVNCVKLQNDGKILCGGSFSQFNGQAKSSLVRLNSNGSIDSSFDIGTGFKNIINSFTTQGKVYTIDIQGDNKILVGGKFLKFNDIVKINLVRLNNNGSIDNSFDIGIGGGNNTTEGMNNGEIKKLIFDAVQNKIYITGIITNFNGNPSKNVKRLNGDGTIDNTFNFTSIVGYNGLNSNGDIYELNLQSNGKLLLGGEFTLNNCANLIQINQDGSIDTNFKFKAIGSLAKVLSIDSSGGDIIVSGKFSSINYDEIFKGSIVKILSNGLTDLSFNANLGAASGHPIITGSIGLDDGTLLANPSYCINYDSSSTSNTHGLYNERASAGLIKISANGSIYENDYNNFFNLNKYSYYLKKDNSSNLISSYTITEKISQNGLPVTSFSPTNPIVAPNNMNFNVFAYDHAVQNDNKIIIGGNFRYNFMGNSSFRQRIMRVNSNGTLDTTFNVGSGINGTSVAGDEGYSVRSLQLMPDGKVMVGGFFSNFNSITVANIVRLNTNGSYDSEFVSGTGFNGGVNAIKYLSDGNKLIVAGQFTNYNSLASNYIIRLNSDGTVDPTFSSPFALGDNTSHITNLVVQSDGKYLVSGMVDNIQFLKRLNQDGSIDNSFANNTYTNETVSYWTFDVIKDINLLPNNKILITGRFSHVNDVRRSGIAVLNNDEILSSVDHGNYELDAFIVSPNPVIDKFSLNTNFDEITIYSLDGRFIKKIYSIENEFDISEFNSGIYLLRIKRENSFYCTKLIKK